MGLRFLTEKQEKEFENGREYTDNDINDLSIFAFGIEALIEVMTEYRMDGSDDNSELNIDTAIFPVFDMLIKPISYFLNNFDFLKIAGREKTSKTLLTETQQEGEEA